MCNFFRRVTGAVLDAWVYVHRATEGCCLYIPDHPRLIPPRQVTISWGEILDARTQSLRVTGVADGSPSAKARILPEEYIVSSRKIRPCRLVSRDVLKALPRPAGPHPRASLTRAGWDR